MQSYVDWRACCRHEFVERWLGSWPNTTSTMWALGTAFRTKQALTCVKLYINERYLPGPISWILKNLVLFGRRMLPVGLLPNANLGTYYTVHVHSSLFQK